MSRFWEALKRAEKERAELPENAQPSELYMGMVERRLEAIRVNLVRLFELMERLQNDFDQWPQWRNMIERKLDVLLIPPAKQKRKARK